MTGKLKACSTSGTRHNTCAVHAQKRQRTFRSFLKDGQVPNTASAAGCASEDGVTGKLNACWAVSANALAWDEAPGSSPILHTSGLSAALGQLRCFRLLSGPDKGH